MSSISRNPKDTKHTNISFYIVSFEFNLKGDDNLDISTLTNKNLRVKDVKEIVSWYKQRLDNLNIIFDDFNLLDIRRKRKRIVITFSILKGTPEGSFFDYLADPDDDGNHPIKGRLVIPIKETLIVKKDCEYYERDFFLQ
jgi:hypothetical protein